jgi:hypothetical protein
LKVPLPIGTFASSVRELRVQAAVPVLPKLVAGAVALFAVLSAVVLTRPPPEDDLARPDVSTLGPEIVAERAASMMTCCRKATRARRRFTRGLRRE